MLDKSFKLEKLGITAHNPDTGARIRGMAPFMCMFNPQQYSENYGIKYQKPNSLDGYDFESTFSALNRQTLSLDLILDGTGVNDLGLGKLSPRQSVKAKIEHLLKVAYKPGSGQKQPYLLQLKWGNGLQFSGKLESLSVKYTLFDKDGTPLHAELSTQFVAHKSASKAAKELKLESTELGKLQLMLGGENLPWKAYEAYKDSSRYIAVAIANKLNNFRRTKIGQKLSFPPLER